MMTIRTASVWAVVTLVRMPSPSRPSLGSGMFLGILMERGTTPLYPCLTHCRKFSIFASKVLLISIFLPEFRLVDTSLSYRHRMTCPRFSWLVLESYKNWNLLEKFLRAIKVGQFRSSELYMSVQNWPRNGYSLSMLRHSVNMACCTVESSCALAIVHWLIADAAYLMK